MWQSPKQVFIGIQLCIGDSVCVVTDVMHFTYAGVLQSSSTDQRSFPRQVPGCYEDLCNRSVHEIGLCGAELPSLCLGTTDAVQFHKDTLYKVTAAVGFASQ